LTAIFITSNFVIFETFEKLFVLSTATGNPNQQYFRELREKVLKSKIVQNNIEKPEGGK
jgi:hypothetical protein